MIVVPSQLTTEIENILFTNVVTWIENEPGYFMIMIVSNFWLGISFLHTLTQSNAKFLPSDTSI